MLKPCSWRLSIGSLLGSVTVSGLPISAPGGGVAFSTNVLFASMNDPPFSVVVQMLLMYFWAAPPGGIPSGRARAASNPRGLTHAVRDRNLRLANGKSPHSLPRFA